VLAIGAETSHALRAVPGRPRPGNSGTLRRRPGSQMRDARPSREPGLVAATRCALSRDSEALPRKTVTREGRHPTNLAPLVGIAPPG